MKLVSPNGPPERDDVLVAEVMRIQHHTRIELANARSATLFEGDLVGVAWGHRYATRQFHGVVPDSHEVCQMLSVGGVCGQVIGAASSMRDPTILMPIGGLVDKSGQRVNLHRFGLRPIPSSAAPTSILVVGSTMDSGKTTAAASIVYGLRRSGARVAAAKLTGTGSAKDLMIVKDAGAVAAIDFTDVGHASTAMSSRQELANIVDVIRSNLAKSKPDYIVMEIADGIVERETKMLLELFQIQQSIDYVIYCCCDSLGVEAGVDRLRQHGLNVAAVSGMATYTPLAAAEARGQTDLPVLQACELKDPKIAAALLPLRDRECLAVRAAG